MHKDFLREIAEKVCTDKAAAMETFHAVMHTLPDGAIDQSLSSASALLLCLREEISAEPDKLSLIEGFTVMFHALTNECQRRMLRRVGR